MGACFSFDGKNDAPPADDVCPICFDDFIIPARTSCRHWYCGCILALWTHRGGVEICKCPKCDCSISKLTVDMSLLDRRDDEVAKVMERVDHYNGMYPEQRPPARPRMSRERERRLLISLVKGYLFIATPLTLIVVFLTFLPRFVTLPHETKEIVKEWLWWSNLINTVLFKCFPVYVMGIRIIADDW